MTIPYERTRAVICTEDFLRDLINPTKTPRIPKYIRQRALSLLKHYPTKFHMEIVSSKEVDTNPLSIEVFGKSL